MCAVFASTRLITFDMASINYAGDCKVLLARSIAPKPFFEVSAKAKQVTELGFKLKSVEFSMGDKVIMFKMKDLDGAYASVETFVSIEIFFILKSV